MECLYQKDEWFVARHLTKDTEHVFPASQCEVLSLPESSIKEFPDKKKAMFPKHHPWYLRRKVDAARRDYFAIMARMPNEATGNSDLGPSVEDPSIRVTNMSQYSSSTTGPMGAQMGGYPVLPSLGPGMRLGGDFHYQQHVGGDLGFVVDMCLEVLVMWGRGFF